MQCRAELLGDRRREIVGERTEIGHRALQIGLLRRQELVALADLGELGRRERVDRFERDQATAEPLQRGDGARLLLLIRLLIEGDAGGIGKRLVLRKTELGADLFFEQSQRA